MPVPEVLDLVVPGAAGLLNGLERDGFDLSSVARESEGFLLARGATPAQARKTLALLAAARFLCSSTQEPGVLLASPDVAKAFMMERLGGLTVEEMHVATLSTKGRLLEVHMVSRGGLAGNLVEPVPVFREAFFRRGAAVVLAHNHPSGDPEPSRDDLAMTQEFGRVGELLGVRVLDHIIVGAKLAVSLKERGVL